MGNNEQFPPPPPPGGTPVPPPQPPQPAPPAYQPPPPQAPQYQQPVQQYPTQQYPQQQGYPPQYGQPPQMPVPTPAPKKKQGVIIAVAVVVVAAIVGGVLLLTGGDDDKDSSPNTPNGRNTVPDDTVVLTVPNDDPQPSTTLAPQTSTTIDSSSDMVTISDDTGTFSVMVPGDMYVETSPFQNQGVNIAAVRASYDLDAFATNDDEYGYSVLVLGGEGGATPAAMIEGLTSPGACAQQFDEQPSPTAYGDALVRRFEGCGSTGQSAKVVMAVQDPASGRVIGFYAQGADSETLAAFAMVIMLTVTLY